MADKESKRVNCGKCNKPLKKIKRYYRNGKYYCHKKCYTEAQKKVEPKEA
ncbi:MAG: hypothetical protein WC732_03715 [Candidatus Omnitrophota bacterium]